MTKEKTISIAGTILVHLVLLLLLLFYYVKPSIDNTNDDELSGVPVMFGNVQDAFGDDKANGQGNGTSGNIEQIEPNLLESNNLDGKDTDKEEIKQELPKVEKQTAVKPEKIVTHTQNVEKTVSVKNNEKEIAQKKAEQAALIKEQQKKTQAEAKAREAEQKKKNINNQLAGLFDGGNGAGNRGGTTGAGMQGSPSGNGDTGKTSGIGGRGSYDLGGRGVSAAGLVLPSYDVDDYGTVVVDIIVDPQGNVIEVNIGRGTTTSNATLRRESIKAARKTKFRVVSLSNNQKGTITYRFNLN